jgi:hypothetical protein
LTLTGNLKDVGVVDSGLLEPNNGKTGSVKYDVQRVEEPIGVKAGWKLIQTEVRAEVTKHQECEQHVTEKHARVESKPSDLVRPNVGLLMSLKQALGLDHIVVREKLSVETKNLILEVDDLHLFFRHERGTPLSQGFESQFFVDHVVRNLQYVL